MLHVALLALALPVLSGHATSARPDLTGTYNLTVLSGGRKETGTMQLTKIAGSMYNAAWTIGQASSRGVCFQDDDNLSCSRTSIGKADVRAYLVRSDGLDGVWFGSGDTALGLEYLIPAKPPRSKNLAGKYTIGSMKDGKLSDHGQRPDKSPYTGTADVVPVGGVDGTYTLRWTIDGKTHSGLGLRSGNGAQDDVLIAALLDHQSDGGAIRYNVQKAGKQLDGQEARQVNKHVIVATHEATRQ